MADGGKVLIHIDGESKGFQSAMNKAGSIAKTAAKGIAVGAGAAATAIGAIGTQAVKAYADYEQLVGGVETLFKQSANVVQNYANQAYQTAGMSANQYMETVTSFSASLLQSLKGDTASAAEYANQAVVDMSDNANKMGTSIEMIQNAYQGFAKQNYTMLDNLKLGYGGTQEEMKRLIKDASKMKDVQKELGITVDANSLTFGNIVNAISVMQKSMGIAGTTAKEASTTIQGSLGMLKASWENLMTALANPEGNVEEAIDDVMYSLETVLNNLGPVIERILQNLPTLIDNLGQELIQKLPTVIENILPSLLDATENLATELAAQIPSLFSAVTDAVGEFVDGIGDKLSEKVPALSGLFENLEPIIAGVAAAFIAYKAATTAAAIGQALLNASISASPMMIIVTLVAAAVAAIITLWNTNEGFRNAVIAIWEAVSSAFSTAWEAVKGAFESFIGWIGPKIETLKEFFSNLWNKLSESLSPVIDAVINAFQSAWELIQTVWGLAKPFFASIWNGIKSVFSVVAPILSTGFKAAWSAIQAVWGVAVSYFSMIWNNIKAVFSVVGTYLSGMFNTAWTAIKAVWSTAISFFAAVWNSIAGIFSAVTAVLKGDFEGAWNAIKGIGSQWGSFFQTVWNNIKSVFSAVGSWFSSTFQAAWNAIKQVWSNVSGFFKNVWEKIKSAFNFSDMNNIGSQILTGLWNGINDKVGWLKSQVKGVVNKIKSWFTSKDGFDENSPSKWSKKVFEYVIDGAVIGIRAKKDVLLNAVASLVEDTRTEVQKVLDEMNEEKLESKKKYEEESERLKDSQLESDKKYLEELKAIAEKERKIYDANQKDIENSQKSIMNSIQNLAETAIDSLEKVEDKQKNFRGKLRDFGDLVGMATFTSGDKEIEFPIVGDYSQINTMLENYLDIMEKLKARGDLPQEFFDQFLDMDVGEATTKAQAFVNMSDEAFNTYMDNYKKSLSLTDKISKVLYADQVEEAKQEVIDAFGQLNEDMEEQGGENAKAWTDGFIEKVREIMPDVISSIGLQFANLLPQGAYAYEAATGEMGTYINQFYLQAPKDASVQEQIWEANNAAWLEKQRGN